MPLDKELEDAIYAAVEEAEQPRTVGQRLVAWLKELSEVELRQDDKVRHLENVRGALKLGRGEHED
jgi:hypothetical protein